MFDGQYKNTLAFIGVAVCTSLFACSNPSEPQSNPDDPENFSIPIPSAIAKARINPDELDLLVSVNGQNVPMMPPDNSNQAEGMPEDTTWSGTIPVPVGQTLQLSVRWSIDLVDLATLDRKIEALTSDSNVIFLPNAYTYPDDDKDNFTNLQELSATPPTEVDNSISIPTSDAVVNPNGIDANGNGIADAEDDTNGRGPAGGWVFHVTNNGQSGLEVAPEDHGQLVRWYCVDDTLPGATGLEVGTGEQNSMQMLQVCAGTGFVDAAVVADTYELNGFTDWFLPSVSELFLIYEFVARDEFGLSGFDENVHLDQIPCA